MFSSAEMNERINRIEILKKEITECRRCSLSQKRIHAVCGEGSLKARLFFIAQAPGAVEDRENRMFVGPSGNVIDELFRQSGLERAGVYMTNMIKCRLPKNRRPKQGEIKACSYFLEREIEAVSPKVLIPLGYYATRYIFSIYINDYKLSPDITGKLYYSGGYKVYPLPHPSSVLYNPSIMQKMKKEFSKVSVFQEDCKWYPVCPMKRYFQEGILERKWIELYCQGDWPSCMRYKMEEKGIYHPDEMLPDGTMI